MGEIFILTALGAGEPVELSRRMPLFAAPGSGEIRALDDPYLSRRPVRIVPGTDTPATALRAHGFELKPTAESLGISRSVLYQLIEACPRVRKAADLGRAEIERVLAGAEGDLEAAARTLEVSAHGLKLRMKALGLR